MQKYSTLPNTTRKQRYFTSQMLKSSLPAGRRYGFLVFNLQLRFIYANKSQVTTSHPLFYKNIDHIMSITIYLLRLTKKHGKC